MNYEDRLASTAWANAVPMDLVLAVENLLPAGWDLPDTKGYHTMRTAPNLKENRLRLDVSISYVWNGKRKLLASGYHMTCYRLNQGKYEQIARKDWEDDGITRNVPSLHIAKFEALRRTLARVIPIAHTIGSPYTRIFTEDTWTSAIIKPQRGYRLNLTDKTRYIAGDTRNILLAYEAYPNHVFARGARKEERDKQNSNGPSPYQKRFNHIKTRLRNLLDPDRKDIDTLWINLSEVGDLLDELAEKTERRPTFHQALMHYLRDKKGMPASQIYRLTGVPTGQVNRAANFLGKPDDKIR